MSPGPGGENAVLRWKAPTSGAGTYRIAGAFTGIDTAPTTVDVAVLDNSAQIFSGNINSYNAPLAFSLVRTVSAGENIDFTVGFGVDGNFFDDVCSVSIAPLSIYVTNAGSNSVSVFSATANGAVTTVTVGSNPVDVALTPDGTSAHVANAGSGTVSVLDTATNTVTATIRVGANPFEVAITPDGSKAYVTNAGGRSVSVINTSTNTVAATVPVGFIPREVAVSPDRTRAYVTNAGSSSVSVIDTSMNTVIATIAVGSGPFSLAIH